MIIFPDDIPRPLTFPSNRSAGPEDLFSGFGAPFIPKEESTWRDLVVELAKKSAGRQLMPVPQYVCMIVCDQSEPSLRMRKVIAERYLDIDRITGHELLLLSTVPPPNDWFVKQLEWIGSLSEPVQSAQRDLCSRLRTDAGLAATTLDEARFIREYFSPDIRLPSLCFLWPMWIEGDIHPSLQAIEFGFSEFSDPKRFMFAIEFLADKARMGSLQNKSAQEFAKSAISKGDVRSLAWKKAYYDTTSAAGLLTSWIKSMQRAWKGGGDSKEEH